MTLVLDVMDIFNLSNYVLVKIWMENTSHTTINTITNANEKWQLIDNFANDKYTYSQRKQRKLPNTLD